MAKFDIRTEATKTFYAGVGVTDLAVEAVRDYVRTVQNIDLEPQALRKEAKARRTAIEKRVADLQADARSLPAKVQALLDENVAAVNGAYGDLASRGEGLVTRVRRQQSTQATAASAQTTTAKAKTTGTQAKKATKSTTQKATGTARKQSAPAKSSAKATGTAAKKTASSATQATTDAAKKVGD